MASVSKNFSGLLLIIVFVFHVVKGINDHEDFHDCESNNGENYLYGPPSFIHEINQ